MLDYTNIQIAPIPLNAIILQKANANLRGENNVLTNILVIIAIGSLLMIACRIFKTQEKENERCTNG